MVSPGSARELVGGVVVEEDLAGREVGDLARSPNCGSPGRRRARTA